MVFLTYVCFQVEIKDVNEDGAYVQLIEYNNREGLILATSVTRKRVKSVKKLLRLGTQDYMQVISVDKEGGFIDLGKKTVQIQDVEEKKKWFEKSKVVHLIMKLTAHQLQCRLDDIYSEFGWDLYDKFEHAYDAFKLILQEPDLVFSKINISERSKEELVKNINKKMAATPIKLRSRFNLQCYTYEGIEAIRESLLEAKNAMKDEQPPLVFQMIAPPQYKCEIVILDKNQGIEKIERAVGIIQAAIKKRGGIFKLVCPPTRIGSKGDGIDTEDIIANLAKNEEDSSGEESNEEGIDIDLEDDGIAHEEDDEEDKEQND